MADGLTVSQTNTENFKISITANLLQFVVPFMKKASYEPDSYQLYEKTFIQMDSHYGAFLNYEYTIDTKSYRLKKIRSLPQVFDKPQYEVQFKSKSPKGSDLELLFSLKGNRKLSLDEFFPESEFWPELKIQIGESDIYVKARG